MMGEGTQVANGPEREITLVRGAAGGIVPLGVRAEHRPGTYARCLSNTTVSGSEVPPTEIRNGP